MSERIWSILASPGQFRNYTMLEHFDIAEESIQISPDCFNKFTLMLHKHYPVFLDILARSCPQNKWPYKELFDYHLNHYPETNEKKLTEASFSTLIKELDTFFHDGRIIDQFYRKAIFDKAVFYLSNDEYQVFRKMIAQNISEELSTAIFEHVKAWDFSENVYKHFFKLDSFETKMSDPETVPLFDNPMNAESLIAFEQPVQYFLTIGKTFFTYDIATQSKTEFLGDKESVLYKNLVNALSLINQNTTKNINTLILVDGNIPVGFISDDKQSRTMLNPDLLSHHNLRPKHYIEHMFYMELLEGKNKGILFIDGHHNQFIKTVIGPEQFVNKEIVLENISTTMIPMYNGKISILHGIEKIVNGVVSEIKHDIIIKTSDIDQKWMLPETNIKIETLTFRNSVELFISGEIVA